MKKLLFLLLFLPFLGNSQATFTAPVGYNTGAPTATPSGVGTRWRFDLLTGKKYTWLPGSLSWDEDARGIDQVAGCSAPLYTPGYNQSTFAVNSCTPKPELYQWTGSAWALLNPETLYTEGTGIDITGGVITNTAPDQTVTMTDGTGIDVTGTYPNFTVTNTAPNVVQELSIDGQDLTLSGGGGTVAIPGGSSLGTGFTSGGGSGSIPDGTVATVSGSFDVIYGNGYSLKNNFVSGEAIADGIGFVADEANYVVVDDNRGNKVFNAHFDVDGAYGDFLVSAGNVIFQNISGDDLSAFQLSTGAVQFSSGNISGSKAFSLTADLGLTFDEDYSADIITNPTSLTDVTSVNLLIDNALDANWPLLAPDGTVSAPSYSFANSGGTGMYFGGGGLALIAGDQLGFTMQAGSGVNGGTFSAYAGNTSEDEVNGGGFTLQAGNSTGADASGGGLSIIAGNGQGSGNVGGGVSIQGGSGTTQGGGVQLFGGNGPTDATDGKIELFGAGVVLPKLTTSQRNALSGIVSGTTIYNTDATANDASTGVMQVYNGTAWKNAW